MLGVPIFFVVSGFCIHVSFQQQSREWGGFFLRRFFRLYPAYLAAVLLFMLLNPDNPNTPAHRGQ
jgi:peptidoglycan/LPS O-acetylase OafA/YrhL